MRSLYGRDTPSKAPTRVSTRADKVEKVATGRSRTPPRLPSPPETRAGRQEAVVAAIVGLTFELSTWPGALSAVDGSLSRKSHADRGLGRFLTLRSWLRKSAMMTGFVQRAFSCQCAVGSLLRWWRMSRLPADGKHVPMLCELPRRFETRWVAWRRMFCGEYDVARCRHASLCVGARGGPAGRSGFRNVLEGAIGATTPSPAGTSEGC